MRQPKYQLKAGKKLHVFQFVSEGPKGTISKIIEFTETNLSGFYNLSFGDKDNETGKMNYKVITNNGDSEKNLATVVSAIYAFTDKYPDVMVYATGSTRARTRFYRMGINKYLNEVNKDFYVYGEIDENWHEYHKDISYEGFAVKRKK
ncbi:MAG TPA: hypothetical protein VNW06_13075 [Cytophagaceae bacterium]|jgi:hypothetical protein|nr:hypothetical protein [Cytophagaceae bacterium]